LKNQLDSDFSLPNITRVSAVGSCRVCGYEPVAFDARNCPQCAASNPNPGIANRCVGRGVVLGLVGGILLGGVWGYATFNIGLAGAFGGALIGSLAGVLLGTFGGIVAAMVIRLVAWVTPKAPAQQRRSPPRPVVNDEPETAIIADKDVSHVCVRAPLK
jgi:hypothetical protein